jgi:hypothetical protein
MSILKISTYIITTGSITSRSILLATI